MKQIAFLALFIAVFAAGGFAQISDRDTVATISLSGTKPIYVKDLKEAIERAVRQQLSLTTGRNPSPAQIAEFAKELGVQNRRQILEMMIDEQLIYQAAGQEKPSMVVSDNEVTQRINQMALSYGMQSSDPRFISIIVAQYGMEMPAFKEQLKRELSKDNYLKAKKPGIMGNIKSPTDSELIFAYKVFKTTRFVRPDTVLFKMIEVPYGANAASKAKAREEATKLANPANFDANFLRGQTPNAGYESNSGYLSMDPEGLQMAGQEILSIVFDLKPGEISKIIEGRQGYQILKVAETYSEQILGLDDIYKLGYNNKTVREFLKDYMYQERMQEATARALQEVITELRAKKTFQIFERNLNW